MSAAAAPEVSFGPPQLKPKAKPKISYKSVPAFRFSTPPRRAPPEPEPAAESAPTDAAPEASASSSAAASNAAPAAQPWELPRPGGVPKAPWELEVEAYKAEVAGAPAPVEPTQQASSEPEEPASLVPHPEVLRNLAMAYHEHELLMASGGSESAADEAAAISVPGDGNLGGFRWSSVMDAAHAAWIGGTRLLRYGELLPGGAEKALACLLAGMPGRDASASSSDAGVSCGRQLALELGMGRGRLALQLFLSGATVIGVELAAERYNFAMNALDRLCHRAPQHFEVSKRDSQSLRIRRKGGPKGSLCEIRHGNFFDVITAEEVRAATLIFCQVCIPAPAWARLKPLLALAHPGSRLLSYEELPTGWEGGCPFRHIGSPNLACSWAPAKGHRFHLYERLERPEPEAPPEAPAAAEALAGVTTSPQSSKSLQPRAKALSKDKVERRPMGAWATLAARRSEEAASA